MRKLVLLVAAAAAFGLTPFASRLGFVAGSLALVAMAVGMALAASGTLDALSAAGGAAGALASGVLSGASPAAAGAALVGLCYAERTVRVRGQTAKLVHVGVAVAGGAIAGTLSGAYAASSPAVRAVATAVAAVLVALPLLVDADDPIAHALEELAGEVGNASRDPLREGAALRRGVDESVLDRTSAREARQTWRSLLRLAEARARLERVRDEKLHGPCPEGSALPADAVANRVDQRIAEHVASLRRAYLALDAANAAQVSLDDVALRTMDGVGESLEHVTLALVEGSQTAESDGAKPRERASS